MAKRFIWFVCNYWTWTILWKCVRITIESIELRMNMEKKKPKKLNGKNSKISHIWFWNLYFFSVSSSFSLWFFVSVQSSSRSSSLMSIHHYRAVKVTECNIQFDVWLDQCSWSSLWVSEWGANVTRIQEKISIKWK